VATYTVRTRNMVRIIETSLKPQEAMQIVRTLYDNPFARDLARSFDRFKRLSTAQWNWVILLAHDEMKRRSEEDPASYDIPEEEDRIEPKEWEDDPIKPNSILPVQDPFDPDLPF
jgi:hypothetical protein